MINLDLKKLAEMTVPERSFLSLYLSGSQSISDLKKKLIKVRRVLKSNEVRKDEREYFDENVKTVEEYLHKYPLKTGALCLFTCQAIGFFQAIMLPAPVNDVIRIKVSVINEILDMLIQSGAEYHFADSMPELREVGGIAALLRY